VSILSIITTLFLAFRRYNLLISLLVLVRPPDAHGVGAPNILWSGILLPSQVSLFSFSHILNPCPPTRCDGAFYRVEHLPLADTIVLSSVEYCFTSACFFFFQPFCKPSLLWAWWCWEYFLQLVVPLLSGHSTKPIADFLFSLANACVSRGLCFLCKLIPLPPSSLVSRRCLFRCPIVLHITVFQFYFFKAHLSSLKSIRSSNRTGSVSPSFFPQSFLPPSLALELLAGVPYSAVVFNFRPPVFFCKPAASPHLLCRNALDPLSVEGHINKPVEHLCFFPGFFDPPPPFPPKI